MLHTKFHGNRSTGFGKKTEGIIPYMGVAAKLAMRPASCR